jgi:molybdenum cofactor cytidylyltransferase
MNITGVLLAAGNSTRFGRDKLVEPFAESSIAVQSAKNILPHVQSLTIVIAANNNLLARQLETLPVNLLSCSDAHLGMAASLVCGITHTQNSDGWLLALADMPFIHADVYTQITAAAHQGHHMVAPVYQGRRGHPVFISQKFREDLLKLTGDRGARDLLTMHASETHTINVNDAGIFRDIDYPQDLLK